MKGLWSTSEEIEDALRTAVLDESIGIILITELAQRADDLIREYKPNRTKP